MTSAQYFMIALVVLLFVLFLLEELLFHSRYEGDDIHIRREESHNRLMKEIQKHEDNQDPG